MDKLPMPSDVRQVAASQTESDSSADTLIEPPSAKLLVRLFLIPFVIVALAVGLMFLISLLAGREPTVEEAIGRLKNPGGQRTADYLIGPGAKQRYLDAKTLTDHMKAGLSSAERVKVTGELVEILDKHTTSDEGEVQHFLLLALGRAWQVDPKNREADSPEIVASRAKVVEALQRYARAKEIPTRKAALLAMVYLKGYDEEVGRLLPTLVEKLRDPKEDLDVRMSAATALGPLAKPTDEAALDALRYAMRDGDPHNVELVWTSALSLAQLGQAEVADTILMLLDRAELANKQVYDREKDAKNPVFRKLSEQEQERILINTIIGVEHFDVPSVQKRLSEIATSDPSSRVRAALQAKSAKDMAGGSR